MPKRQQPPIPLGTQLVNRHTGEPAGKVIPIKHSEWPYRDILRPQALLRCMDIWKLEKMCEKKGIFFAKARHFTDTLEGMPSKRGIHGTSEHDLRFRAAYPLLEDYDRLQADREVAKDNTFVSCWAMRAQEIPRMWMEYPKSGSHESVTLATSVKALKVHCPSGLLGSAVTYVSQDFPKTMFGEMSWFLYKDKTSYDWEREYRLLLSVLSDVDPRRIEHADGGCWVFADLAEIVTQVILHPLIPDAAHRDVAMLARRFFPGATLRRSRLKLQH